MQQVTLDEAKKQLDDLINAALKGEKVYITQDDAPLVQLVPLAQQKKNRRPGSAKRRIIMSDDFDEPLPDFREYME